MLEEVDNTWWFLILGISFLKIWNRQANRVRNFWFHQYYQSFTFALLKFSTSVFMQYACSCTLNEVHVNISKFKIISQKNPNGDGWCDKTNKITAKKRLRGLEKVPTYFYVQLQQLYGVKKSKVILSLPILFPTKHQITLNLNIIIIIFHIYCQFHCITLTCHDFSVHNYRLRVSLFSVYWTHSSIKNGLQLEVVALVMVK